LPLELPSRSLAGLRPSDKIRRAISISREIVHLTDSLGLHRKLLDLKKFMAYTLPCKSTVSVKFLKPLFEFLDLSRSRRNCPALPDELWLEAGIRRCLGLFQSGRDFLQHLGDRHHIDILRTTFFESLKSTRRLALLDEILVQCQAQMRKVMPDPFAAFKCLDDFDLYAGDGHFISAASHDKAKPRKKPSKNKSTPKKSATKKPLGRTDAFTSTKYATGHIYTLCLRSHSVTHMTVSDQIERNKEHDMRALKRQTPQQLRQNARKGRKVLYIWDRAGIDFQQWFKWKENGIYFLSREKENMKLEILGIHLFDRADPINQGVISDEIVATSMGVTVRRVVYQDPETDIIYIYITNLQPSISPGIVALLYKARWDVEKVFDEFKNKLGESKSWASTATAKTNQARLLCLTHNLMTLMEEYILQETGIYNLAEIKRKKETLTKRDEDSKNKGNQGLSILQKTIQRLTQRTVKFIRWLKNHFDTKATWAQALTRLAKIYATS
jgi:Transposase DDE domain